MDDILTKGHTPLVYSKLWTINLDLTPNKKFYVRLFGLNGEVMELETHNIIEPKDFPTWLVKTIIWQEEPFDTGLETKKVEKDPLDTVTLGINGNYDTKDWKSFVPYH